MKYLVAIEDERGLGWRSVHDTLDEAQIWKKQ